MQWPRGKNRDVHWGSKLLQILQEVRSNCKTRNQLAATKPDKLSEVSNGPSTVASGRLAFTTRLWVLLTLELCEHVVVRDDVALECSRNIEFLQWVRAQFVTLFS